MNTVKQTFFKEGLRFSCTRCSACCRHEPGYVFLSKSDLKLLAEALNFHYYDVMERYCRWVPVPGGETHLSLNEKPGFDCIFWDGGCTIYQARPLQCRTFPFWKSTLSSIKAWKNLSCPGIGKGLLHSAEYIENCLSQRIAEPILARGA
jgi:Fe-S-cluster containining protein